MEDGGVEKQIIEIHRSEKVKLSQSCQLNVAWMVHQN